MERYGRLVLRRVLACAWLLWVVSGCATSYRWPPGGAAVAPGTYQTVEQRRWAHLFVFGLIGRSYVDLRDVCPGPLGEGLRTGATLETTLVSLFSLGIYTPVEHRFTCLVPPPGPALVPQALRNPGQTAAPPSPAISAEPSPPEEP